MVEQVPVTVYMYLTHHDLQGFEDVVLGAAQLLLYVAIIRTIDKPR